MSVRRAGLVALAAVAAVALGAGAYALGAGRAEDEAGDRQELVAERGAAVMPFDLDRTTHVFAKGPTGGIQTVTADDPDDAEQIALIRSHLREEAAAFGRGEFADPAAIHGMAMPGLAVLRARYGDVDIVYEDAPAGARIVYASDDAELVRALHEWFDAQLMDHGDDASDGQ
jgi:hypothetical protein